MDKLKALYADAQNRFANLTTRERRLVIIASAGLLVFVLFVSLFSFNSSATSIRKRTATKLAKLEEVQGLAASFREAEQQRTAVERQLSNNGIQLISYISDKGTSAGLDIQTMNPKGDIPIGDGNIVESSVELTLTDIDLRKLVNFLNSVEQGGMVKVKSLRIEPKASNETLIAWTTISTYRLKR